MNETWNRWTWSTEGIGSGTTLSKTPGGTIENQGGQATGLAEYTNGIIGDVSKGGIQLQVGYETPDKSAQFLVTAQTYEEVGEILGGIGKKPSWNWESNGTKSHNALQTSEPQHIMKKPYVILVKPTLQQEGILLNITINDL